MATFAHSYDAGMNEWMNEASTAPKAVFVVSLDMGESGTFYANATSELSAREAAGQWMELKGLEGCHVEVATHAEWHLKGIRKNGLPRKATSK